MLSEELKKLISMTQDIAERIEAFEDEENKLTKNTKLVHIEDVVFTPLEFQIILLASLNYYDDTSKVEQVVDRIKVLMGQYWEDDRSDPDFTGPVTGAILLGRHLNLIWQSARTFVPIGLIERGRIKFYK